MEDTFRQEELIADPISGEVDFSSARSWTVDEVGQWLTRQGFSNYAGNFREHDVSGAELLNLDASDYVELGITQVGVRKRLQEAVAALRTRMLQVTTRPFRRVAALETTCTLVSTP
jgi:hypothetical protein